MKKNEYLLKMNELIRLIQKLRAPDGCPWDRQQKKEDVGKYILEEAYEVVDSLAQDNPQELKEELGDLLFQILFLTEISTEEELFSLSDVLDEITKKMIRRHPHVFGDATVNSVREVKDNWQKIKAEERADKSDNSTLFDSVPLSFPALKRAQKITSIASHYGFDWSNSSDILGKMEEELMEFKAALKNDSRDKIEEELGDMLFTLVNLSRFHSIDAETALTKTTKKFLRRFAYVTGQLSARGINLQEATLPQMDELWNESKNKDLK
ncbi:MAG TPA: nucleoside triphosphate pyrophosphohydrolase [Candidatus Moranbacteria bacterium]|nr:nucleoside triphosphate pyrophosphohydrolase [Candidatus Moranbacteria bacterium]